MSMHLHVIYVKLEHVYIMCHMHVHPSSICMCTMCKYGTCVNTFSTYRTYEMAILIIHIVIYYWNLMINEYYVPHISDQIPTSLGYVRQS
jgi:hypothetical protein